MVKIAQTFAFGRKKANQGGLPGLTIGFFQQSLDSWRAFVIIIILCSSSWKPLRLTRLLSPILHDELQERSDGSTTAHSSKIISNNTLNVLWCYREVYYKTPDPQRNWLCLNHTVQKDSRGVLGTSCRFGPTSEILENIQYGGSSVVKTDSQRSRFIATEAWFTVLLTKFAFIVSFEVFLVLYSKQSFYKCLINLSCPAGRYYRKK